MIAEKNIRNAGMSTSLYSDQENIFSFLVTPDQENILSINKHWTAYYGQYSVYSNMYYISLICLLKLRS